MINDRQRVVWYEGMTLDPHHFQQMERYQQTQLNGRMRALTPFDWGVVRLTIDRERLANGELAVTRCSAVLPDGFVVEVPDADDPPPPRNLQDAFPATQERLGVYLALPAVRTDGSNILLQGAERRRETRYQARTIALNDDTTGVDERSVEVAQANLQIRFEGEPIEAYTTLKIASVMRDVSGAYVLDDRFIPPCLSVGGSDRLQTLQRRLIELLVAKTASLTERQRTTLAQRELSPGDIAALGLLSTINGALPRLQHHYQQTGTHPEALYLTIASFAGQLAAYLPDAPLQPRNVPAYDHSQPAACFNRLDSAIRDMLGEAKPQANYIQLPLQQQRENLFTTDVDANLLQQAQLFLIARSDAHSEDELVSELPLKLRVAAPSNIEAVLRSYTRALAIEHTHRLPVGMPVDQQANYFQLQKRGPFWDSIRADGGIAVFIPSEMDDLKLQLVAVQG